MTAPVENLRGFVKFSTPYAEADAGFVQYIDDQAEWAREIFGPGKRTLGVLNHIRKELAEIEQEPGDLDEWVDVVILALDGACRQGFTGSQVVDRLYSKFHRNTKRSWPDWRGRSEDEPIEHNR